MLRISYLFLIIVLIALGGCKGELYRNLPERETNEMLSLLSRHGINADKRADKKGKSFTLIVSKRHFADAVDILSLQGYPRRQRNDIGDLFKKSGLIPTPFEEHIRYVYGLSQELSETISRLDGVIDTRVHIAIPQESKNTAKASVYIKYDDSFNYSALKPQIQKLVADSIERVTLENVDVLALPSQRTLYDVGITGSNHDTSFLLVVIFILAGSLLLAVIFAGLLLRGRIDFGDFFGFLEKQKKKR